MPQIEDADDSDLEFPVADPEEFDIDEFADADILRSISGPVGGGGGAPSAASAAAAAAAAAEHAARRDLPDVDPKTVADYQCLYPIYFDATRSRREGRRVAAQLAVRCPLAVEIARACTEIGLRTVVEPEKTHPQDWANPGRVRVRLREGRPQPGPDIKGKHHLYLLVATFLHSHPTTEHCEALRVRVRGAPPGGPAYGDPWPRPAVPRGWKVGDLLPYTSPAITGGGVADLALQDVMRDMQKARGVSGSDETDGTLAALMNAAAAAAATGVTPSMLGAGGGGQAGGKKGNRKAKGRGKA